MPKTNHAAFEIGELAQRLYQGYYLHSAMLQVSTHPEVHALAPPVEPGHAVPIGRVYRKDGSFHAYHFTHYLDWAKNNLLISDDLTQVWIVGAFLRLGDELAQYKYFDHAPELELIYHLRNGVAHGNRFHIKNTSRLNKYPAHNRFAYVHAPATFEIVPSLDGMPILCDFMGAGDCLDLIQSVSVYLIRMGNGDPLRR